jgi:hypothetical protein
VGGRQQLQRAVQFEPAAAYIVGFGHVGHFPLSHYFARFALLFPLLLPFQKEINSAVPLQRQNYIEVFVNEYLQS